MGNNRVKNIMKRLILLSFIIIFLMSSCNKSDDWFMDNGWHEVTLSYGNTSGIDAGIGMEMDQDGNVVGYSISGGFQYYHYTDSWAFRLYSTFDKVDELVTAPSDGYTTTIVCNKTRYGVIRYCSSWWTNSNGYNSGHSYEYFKFCPNSTH